MHHLHVSDCLPRSPRSPRRARDRPCTMDHCAKQARRPGLRCGSRESSAPSSQGLFKLTGVWGFRETPCGSPSAPVRRSFSVLAPPRAVPADDSPPVEWAARSTRRRRRHEVPFGGNKAFREVARYGSVKSFVIQGQHCPCWSIISPIRLVIILDRHQL